MVRLEGTLKITQFQPLLWAEDRTVALVGQEALWLSKEG